MPVQPLDLMWCSRPGCPNRPVARHVTPEVLAALNAATEAGEAYDAEGETVCSLHLMEILEADVHAKLAPIELPQLKIDPTEVLTPDDCETELKNLLNRLDDGTLFLRAHLQRLEDVETNFALARAGALAASTQKNMQLREAEALLACEDLFRLVRAETVIVKSTEKQLHNIRTFIDTWRSINTSVRAAYENANRAGHGA